MQTTLDIHAKDVDEGIKRNESLVKALHSLNSTVTKKIIALNNETMELKRQKHARQRQLGELKHA